MASLELPDMTPGQILDGKFRVERILGRGGMGCIVLATHIKLDELVALKLLLPEALQHPEALRRFETEARAAAKIKGEHVARVTDVGSLPSGLPYLVMEYLRGQDLAQRLTERGPFSVEEAVLFILQANEAIAEAHALGIVHRDLKPSNLFYTERQDGSPCIKVLDFGISKFTLNTGALTQTSSMIGTPYYMSPEQMTSSKDVDTRTDIWSLGVILHELLTGKVPYPGDTIPEICAGVLQEPPPPLTRYRPDAPVGLELVLQRALAKNREERYPHIAAWSAALQPFAPQSVQGGKLAGSQFAASRLPQEAPPPPFIPQPLAHTSLTEEGTVYSQLSPVPKHRLLPTPVLLGLLGAALLALILFLVFREDPAPPALVPKAIPAPEANLDPTLDAPSPSSNPTGSSPVSSQPASSSSAAAPSGSSPSSPSSKTPATRPTSSPAPSSSSKSPAGSSPAASTAPSTPPPTPSSSPGTSAPPPAASSSSPRPTPAPRSPDDLLLDRK